MLLLGTASFADWAMISKIGITMYVKGVMFDLLEAIGFVTGLFINFFFSYPRLSLVIVNLVILYFMPW
jgi:hypothetical protein